MSLFKENGNLYFNLVAIECGRIGGGRKRTSKEKLFIQFTKGWCVHVLSK